VNWLPAYGSSRLPSRSPHARVRTQWRTAGLRPKATPTDAALAGGCQNLEVTCHAPLPAAAPRLSTRGGCPWAEQWSAEKASAGSPRKEPASDPSAARGAAPTSPMRPPAPAPAALCEEELEVEDLDLDALEAEVNNVPQQLQDKVRPSSDQEYQILDQKLHRAVNLGSIRMPKHILSRTHPVGRRTPSCPTEAQRHVSSGTQGKPSP
jgi:hypothetical protein